MAVSRTGRIFTIKHGDTRPRVRAIVRDDTDTIVDLTGWQVRFHLCSPDRREVLVDAAASVVPPETQGLVEYAWAPGDTARLGEFPAEWEGTDPTGGVWTFPNDRDLTVRVVREIV